VQGEALNRSRIDTVGCVPLTSNVRWAEAPGNVLLPARGTQLTKESVANVSQIVTIDRARLTERVGPVSRRQLDAILDGSARVAEAHAAGPMPFGLPGGARRLPPLRRVGCYHRARH
jgi:mRNA-degrading endonuclease toxin of MazEF toxin-antitoxin module